MQLTRQSKIQYWTELVKEWEHSGETQPAFCERKAIKLTNFCKWRHRLKKYDHSNVEEDGLPQFVEAALVDSMPNQTGGTPTFSLTLSTGHTLSLPLSSTKSQLCIIFSALGLV